MPTADYHLHGGALKRARPDLLLLYGIGRVQPAIRDAVAFGILEQPLQSRGPLVAHQGQGALLALHQQQAPRGKGGQQDVAHFRIDLDQFRDRLRRNHQNLARRDGGAVGEGRLAEKERQLARELPGFHGPQDHSIGIPYLNGGRNRVHERVVAVFDPVECFAAGYRASLAVSLERGDRAPATVSWPFSVPLVEIFEHCPSSPTAVAKVRAAA